MFGGKPKNSNELDLAEIMRRLNDHEKRISGIAELLVKQIDYIGEVNERVFKNTEDILPLTVKSQYSEALEQNRKKLDQSFIDFMSEVKSQVNANTESIEQLFLVKDLFAKSIRTQTEINDTVTNSINEIQLLLRNNQPATD